jgi:hypothetical protein
MPLAHHFVDGLLANLLAVQVEGHDPSKLPRAGQHTRSQVDMRHSFVLMHSSKHVCDVLQCYPERLSCHLTFSLKYVTGQSVLLRSFVLGFILSTLVFTSTLSPSFVWPAKPSVLLVCSSRLSHRTGVGMQGTTSISIDYMRTLRTSSSD